MKHLIFTFLTVTSLVLSWGLNTQIASSLEGQSDPSSSLQKTQYACSHVDCKGWENPVVEEINV